MSAQNGRLDQLDSGVGKQLDGLLEKLTSCAASVDAAKKTIRAVSAAQDKVLRGYS
jgi:hypothetical protein